MRILLLTLYYPPLNTIAALRLNAFAKEFKTLGHNVDVITRFYDEEQAIGGSMLLGVEPPSNFEEDYIIEENVIRTNFHQENKLLKKSRKLPPGIRGLYNYKEVDVFHYSWLALAKEAFQKEWSNRKYDIIIASYGPPIMLRAGKEFSELTETPWVMDFRDAYITEKDQGLQLFLKKKVQHRYIKTSSGILFATEGMVGFYNKNAIQKAKKYQVVYNGVNDESGIVDENNEVVLQFNKLQHQYNILLLHTGTIYKGQDINFFIDTIDELNALEPNSIGLAMLGLSKNNVKLATNKDVHILTKVNHSTSLYLQQKADALVLPIWAGRYTGFSGKTFEYLNSGNIILTSPNPQNDLKPFFESNSNVLVNETAQELKDNLQKIHQQEIKKQPVVDEKLTRKYWIGKLHDFLLELKQSQ